MDIIPKITFASGVGTVTGANFLFDAGAKILIDCGLIQGERVAMENNAGPFPYEINSISALVVTHAHLDHVGRIPKLVKEGFKGTIYSTPETKALAQIVLEDAVGILEMEAKQEGVLPLYEAADVQAVFPLWKTVPYHQSFEIAQDINVIFKDAGHILGSAMVEITVKKEGKETKVLFTGDLGNSPSPLLRDTEAPGDVDYIVMESVYGDRNHESHEERSRLFEKVVRDTLSRGGTLVIPAFSVDRTQVMLYELNNMVEEEKIPSVPVFLDSPMGTKATEIYKMSSDLFNVHAQAQIARGDDLFSFPRLHFTTSPNESRGIDHSDEVKIILAGSGMSVGGRVIGHEERFLPDPKSTILLVGYQTVGSLGRQLSDGAKKVNIHGRTIHVKAKVENLYGYSAHKDSDHLLEFVASASKRLKKAFVVMGEPSASMHLAQRINEETDKKAAVPEIGTTVSL